MIRWIKNLILEWVRRMLNRKIDQLEGKQPEVKHEELVGQTRWKKPFEKHGTLE